MTTDAVDLYKMTGCLARPLILCTKRSLQWLSPSNITSISVVGLYTRSLYVVVRLSVCLSVCRLSVTFVHPTQVIEIFGNVSTPFGTWPSVDIQVKFYGDRPRGTPPSGELNTFWTFPRLYLGNVARWE